MSESAAGYVATKGACRSPGRLEAASGRRAVRHAAFPVGISENRDLALLY